MIFTKNSALDESKLQTDYFSELGRVTFKDRYAEHKIIPPENFQNN
jgi:hypothetical protein